MISNDSTIHTAREAHGLGLADIPRAVARHPRKALLTFCSLLGLAIAAVILLPRAYESESLVFVRVGRESVTLDPTVTTGQVIALNESRESELNSILEVLKSRGLMERVVDRLGAEAILSPGGEKSGDEKPNQIKQWIGDATGTVLSWLEPAGPISAREKAIQSLGDNVSIYAKQKSNIISISYRARSPRQAQKIVSGIVNEYLREHQRIHATAGSYNFFVDQAELFSDKLNDAQSELMTAKNEMGLASLEGKRQLIEDRIKNISTDRLSVQSAASASTAKIASLEKLIGDLPARITTQEVEGMPNVAGDNMRQKLYELEIQEKELASKYTDKHPLVIAVREKVSDAKEILADQAPSRTYATTAVNPSAQKLQLELLVETAAADAFKARLKNLDEELHLAQTDLRTINDHELKLSDLQRQVSLAEASYRTYADKLEEARIQQSLDEEHISNLNITQPATLVEKPVSPKKALVLLAGLLLAATGAVAVAVMAEWKNRTLRSPLDVEEQLGIPVVVTLPARSRDNVLMN